MLTLPAFQAGESSFFRGRVRDHQKRHLRSRLRRGTRWGDARRLALHLAKVRRPGRVAETCGFVFGRKPEQRFEGTCVGIHTRVWVAQLRETLRNRQHGKTGRITFRNFVPAKPSGYARIRQRAHGIRRARRTVLRILVVVERHAVPLLLPPLRSGQGRYAPLDGTRKRERGTPHFDERPAWFNPRIHVHTTRTARFRPASKPHLLEKRFHFESDAPYIVPTDARPRSEEHTSE